MTAEIVVRRARPADAARLSAFAAATFRDTYGELNTAADMTEYLAKHFSPALQGAEIADPAQEVLLAEGPDLAGYAHLAAGDAPGAVSGPAPLELKRFYVAREWHGRGVARRLFEATLAAAGARGAGTLWLGVWERNARAIAFYQKCGFTRAGTQTFVLGNDAQTDWVLVREVGIRSEGEG